MWHKLPLPSTPFSKATASSPFISHVDYKWSFDKRAFWVSDNRIIILLKSVLIVSKLLVIVSSPGDLGGRRHFEQTHWALMLVFVTGEEWQMEITCVPQYAKWLPFWKMWASWRYLIANIKEPLGCMSGVTAIPRLSFHLIEMHSIVLPQPRKPTEASPYFAIAFSQPTGQSISYMVPIARGSIMVNFLGVI